VAAGTLLLMMTGAEGAAVFVTGGAGFAVTVLVTAGLGLAGADV
jgi:hypothetical protein